MSTSMMVMEFLPYCKSGDKETDETIITVIVFCFDFVRADMHTRSHFPQLELTVIYLLKQTLRETHRKEIALDARDANGNTMLILSTMYRLVWAVRPE